MELNFVYKEDFIDILKTTTYDQPIDSTKGIYTLSNENIYINLSCPIWTQLYKYAGEYLIISELSNTILHEHLHYTINTKEYNQYTEEAEESIVESIVEE